MPISPLSNTVSWRLREARASARCKSFEADCCSLTFFLSLREIPNPLPPIKYGSQKTKRIPISIRPMRPFDVHWLSTLNLPRIPAINWSTVLAFSLHILPSYVEVPTPSTSESNCVWKWVSTHDWCPSKKRMCVHRQVVLWEKIRKRSSISKTKRVASEDTSPAESWS